MEAERQSPIPPEQEQRNDLNLEKSPLEVMMGSGSLEVDGVMVSVQNLQDFVQENPGSVAHLLTPLGIGKGLSLAEINELRRKPEAMEGLVAIFDMDSGDQVMKDGFDPWLSLAEIGEESSVVNGEWGLHLRRLPGIKSEEPVSEDESMEKLKIAKNLEKLFKIEQMVEPKENGEQIIHKVVFRPEFEDTPVEQPE